jgi:hypothetical protein
MPYISDASLNLWMYWRVKNTATILSYLQLNIVIDIRYIFSNNKTGKVTINIKTVASSRNVYTSRLFYQPDTISPEQSSFMAI